MPSREPLIPLLAYLGSIILVSLFLYPPIIQWLLVRSSFSAEEIAREHIEVRAIEHKAAILFSNGQRVPYRPALKTNGVVILSILWVLDVLLVTWVLKRWDPEFSLFSMGTRPPRDNNSPPD